MKRTLLLLFCLGLFAAGCADDSPTIATDGADDPTVGLDGDESLVLASHPVAGFGLGPQDRTYEITLENLTPDTGDGGAQVFSPPVIATHNRGIRMFRVGRFATEELAQIAEDAVNGPMISRLQSSSRVHEVQEGDGVIPPGSSATYTIRTTASLRQLSMAFMLVNTNDGFSGIDAMRLPRGGSAEVYLRAYDAGSELNTESSDHIPGPCCGSPGAGIPEHRRIRMHEGIRGDADLSPEKYGWEGPVAKLTIRRLAPIYEITLENLSPDTGDGGSQIFSPPVLATHLRGMHMFRIGHRASEELAQIAEDAINGPMIERLEGSSSVFSVQEGEGVVPPGASASYRIEGGRDGARLSMAFMLVNTNDGFSGVNALRLRRSGRFAYYLRAFDAGSEANTELASDIPGPCCGSPGAGTATDERIRVHRGITGVGDLTVEKYGWDEPVAKLTVARVQ